jgi:hypothetical protein
MYLVPKSSNEKLSRDASCAALNLPIAKTCPSTCPFQADGSCYVLASFRGRKYQDRLRDLSGDSPHAEAAREMHEAHRETKKRPLRLFSWGGDATCDIEAMHLASGAANWDAPVWGYTHGWRTTARDAWGRVSILASVESVSDAKEAISRGYKPAMVVPYHPEDGRAEIVDGLRMVPCPAQTRDRTCTECRLCWDDSQKNSVITFAAHGVRAKSVKRHLEVLR